MKRQCASDDDRTRRASEAAKKLRLRRVRPVFAILVGSLAVSVAGCASHSAPETISVQKSSWEEAGKSGATLTTPHYILHTTFTDPDERNALARTMEAAFQQYQRLAAAGVPRPMTGYVFARREEWRAFTEQHITNDAATYLRINRGGYTVGDEFTVFSAGQGATLASMAHEGWHQYVARTFRDRLPPFLEEGIACTFENVALGAKGQPVFNLVQNPKRSRGLRMASEAGQLRPLETLLQLHAGEVVRMENGNVEAYYAQAWALARFLMEGDNQTHRPAFDRMLKDAVQGRLSDQHLATPRRLALWDSSMARPLLEAYLGQPIAATEQSYVRYIDRLVQQDERFWSQ